ncbi:MAG: BlaI/MecI/CopY family transcriptional regulator [Gemmatimonadetes bacterium]|nr:BlaI/MecI/CopY family transcriptional regulator [Gemmatimonadota bacterium]
MGSPLTDREMDVMAVLWDLGSATVTEVQGRLDDDLAYTTVLTILRILEEKGIVRHEKEGRAHRFMPRLGRAEAGQTLLDRLRDKVFAGSSELLMTHLVAHEELPADTMRKLRALLDEKLGQTKVEEE